MTEALHLAGASGTSPSARARDLIVAARAALGEGAQSSVDTALDRLTDPLRIAIAGRVKAGKSTLLNAILGEDVAPTGTAEVTSIVTWYRAGPTPRIRVVRRDGRMSSAPIARVDASLAGSNAQLDPRDVQRIDVEWPAPALENMTLVDTPGLASLSVDVSASSEAVLLPDNGIPDVDGLGSEPLSGAWWATRPLWWGALAAVTVGFIAVFGRFETPTKDVRPAPPTWLAILACVAMCAGLGVMAMFGIVDRAGVNWWWPLVPIAGLVLTGMVPLRR